MSQPKCSLCKNDIWRVREWENKAYCENCNTSRPWYPRKRRTDQMTPSQIKAIKRVKCFFTNEWRGKESEPLTRFGVKFEPEFGTVFLFIETAGNTYAKRGGMFYIGRRGKAECLHVYDIGGNDNTVKHYNYMVKK